MHNLIIYCNVPWLEIIIAFYVRGNGVVITDPDEEEGWMGPFIDTDWQYRGLQVVRIENENIRLDVLPEVGAKIYNFVHKASNKNLLWHNPRVPPERAVYGSLFDDHWAGGWDELLPNDVPFKIPSGETLPDHGEVWSQASEWRVVEESGDAVAVRFVTHGRILPTRFEKTISLHAGESFCSVQYAYINLGAAPIDFLWNICCPFEISSATRLDIPARRGIIEATDPWNTLKFNPGTEYEWPYAVTPAGERVDFRTMPPEEAGVTDFQYLPNLASGWFAVTDADAQVGFGMVFPTDVIPHLSLFRSVGGWRGQHLVSVEPSVGYPYDLAVAKENGTAGRIEADAALEAKIKAIAYEGVAAVERIEPDGSVIARGQA